MASGSYLSAIDDAVRGNIDFDTDVFYAMLVSGYTPNFTAHTKRSDVTGEITGTGYTAGGTACAVTVTKNTGPGNVVISLGAVSWPASTLSATGCVYYKRRGGAATADELIGFDDFGATVSSTAAAFNVAASSLTLTRTS